MDMRMAMLRLWRWFLHDWGVGNDFPSAINTLSKVDYEASILLAPLDR